MAFDNGASTLSGKAALAAGATRRADPDVQRYAGRALSSAELARTCGVADAGGSRPDSWRYLDELQDPGRPAIELGCR